MVLTSLERTFAHIFPVHYQPTSWTLEGAVNPRDKFLVSALLSSQRDVWSNFLLLSFIWGSYQMLCKASRWLLFLRVKKWSETILVVLEHFGSARSSPWLMTLLWFSVILDLCLILNPLHCTIIPCSIFETQRT